MLQFHYLFNSFIARLACPKGGPKGRGLPHWQSHQASPFSGPATGVRGCRGTRGPFLLHYRDLQQPRCAVTMPEGAWAQQQACPPRRQPPQQDRGSRLPWSELQGGERAFEALLFYECKAGQRQGPQSEAPRSQGSLRRGGREPPSIKFSQRASQTAACGWVCVPPPSSCPISDHFWSIFRCHACLCLCFS